MDPIVRGYRGAVRDVRRLVSEAQGIALLRADRVFGADHLRHAAHLAARAHAEDRARTRDLATETLLYAAAERQIGRALALVGLQNDTRALAAIAWDASALDALAAREGWTRDDDVLQGAPDALDALGITPAERAMLPPDRWGDLVLERVALVDVMKG